MEINLEKFITSLLNTKVNIPEVNIIKRMIEHALEEQGLKYYNGSILVKDDEPKFKVGDWVVNKLGDAWHIDSFDKKNYQVSDRKGNYNYFPISKQDEMHLWTIQDAKDGDVIFYDDGWTCIFKNIHGIWYSSYCFITADGEFHTVYEQHAVDAKLNGNANPATKEQRDLLFQKMKEAGYEWDAEKKELKKIIAPIFHIGDWIINIEYGNVVKVLKVLENNYRLDFGVDTIGTLCTAELVDNDYRLWTINDAKDGDVLAVENMIFIYKTVLASHVVSYCKLFNNKFELFNDARTCCEGNSKIHPATKEQRELLFQKMKEAGYEWDAEKKELKN